MSRALISRYTLKRFLFIASVGFIVILWRNLHESNVVPTTDTGLVVTSTVKIATSSLNLVTVVRIVDGDTVEIEGGQKVRYIGMNTPESVDPRRPVQCFGKEASNYNKELVLNKKVTLVKDVSDKDKYGRLLRYVYLEDGTFINLKMITDGYATVMTVPPNVSKSKDFVAAEREAREAKRGLWEKCK